MFDVWSAVEWGKSSLTTENTKFWDFRGGVSLNWKELIFALRESLSNFFKHRVGKEMFSRQTGNKNITFLSTFVLLLLSYQRIWTNCLSCSLIFRYIWFGIILQLWLRKPSWGNIQDTIVRRFHYGISLMKLVRQELNFPPITLRSCEQWIICILHWLLNYSETLRMTKMIFLLFLYAKS